MLWVVSGTGTGVGKTAVAVALVRALARTGSLVAGWKPLETGVPDGVGAAGPAHRPTWPTCHPEAPRCHPEQSEGSPWVSQVQRTEAARLLSARHCSLLMVDPSASPQDDSGGAQDDRLDDALVLLGPDQLALLAESTFHVKRDAHRTFPLPASPHLAAREAGVRLTLDPIIALANELRLNCSVVLELAGGLFTPLTDDLLNVDLVMALAPDRHIMVAPDRLGVLHDAIAATTAATARGSSAAPDALLVNQCTPSGANLNNTMELRRYVALPVFGPLGYGDVDLRADQLASMFAAFI